MHLFTYLKSNPDPDLVDYVHWGAADIAGVKWPKKPTLLNTTDVLFHNTNETTCHNFNHSQWVIIAAIICFHPHSSQIKYI